MIIILKRTQQLINIFRKEAYKLHKSIILMYIHTHTY